jgi:hypothetical protein
MRDSCPFVDGLAVVVSGLSCWWASRRAGRFLARRFASLPNSALGTALHVLPVALSLLLLWPVLIYLAGLMIWSVSVAQLLGQENPYLHESYMLLGCANILLMGVAVLIGVVLTLKSAAARAEAPAPAEPR